MKAKHHHHQITIVTDINIYITQTDRNPPHPHLLTPPPPIAHITDLPCCHYSKALCCWHPQCRNGECLHEEVKEIATWSTTKHVTDRHPGEEGDESMKGHL